jgi:hypothetical protein
MRLRPVSCIRRRPVRQATAQMTGHALALIEDLYRAARVADVRLLANQLIGCAVVVLIRLDVIIEVYTRLLPLRILEPPGRQRLAD